MAVFDDFVNLTQGSGKAAKDAIRPIIVDLKTEVGTDGLTQAEISKVADKWLAQIEALPDGELKTKGKELLNGLKAVPEATLNQLKDSTKANEFLNGFVEMLDATTVEEAKKAKEKSQEAAPDFFQIIIGAILTMLGFSPEQVAAFTGQDAAPATAAEATTTAPAAVADYPSPIETAGRAGGLFPDTPEGRLKARSAEYITRYLSQNPGQLLESPEESAEQIKARISTGIKSTGLDSDVAGENLTKDYYKNLAKFSALKAITGDNSWEAWGSYAVKGLQIWDYDGSVEDRDLAKSSLDNASLNPTYEAIGLTGGTIQFDKGAIIEGQSNSFTFEGSSPAIDNAKQDGRKQAENTLISSYKQGIIPVFEADNLTATKGKIDGDITATQENIRKKAFEKEKLLAAIGMHETRIELNNKLAETPDIGQGRWSLDYSEDEIKEQANSASAQHQTQKNIAIKKLEKIEEELSKDVSKLIDLNKESGKLEQQLEYAKGEDLVTILNQQVEKVNAIAITEEKERKAAADKVAADKAFAAQFSAVPAGALLQKDDNKIAAEETIQPLYSRSDRLEIERLEQIIKRYGKSGSPEKIAETKAASERIDEIDKLAFLNGKLAADLAIKEKELRELNQNIKDAASAKVAFSDIQGLINNIDGKKTAKAALDELNVRSDKLSQQLATKISELALDDHKFSPDDVEKIKIIAQRLHANEEKTFNQATAEKTGLDDEIKKIRAQLEESGFNPDAIPSAGGNMRGSFATDSREGNQVSDQEKRLAERKIDRQNKHYHAHMKKGEYAQADGALDRAREIAEKAELQGRVYNVLYEEQHASSYKKPSSAIMQNPDAQHPAGHSRT